MSHHSSLPAGPADTAPASILALGAPARLLRVLPLCIVLWLAVWWALA
ncbi:hypothetical protein [Chitiniphilus eburneus]|nr:hypothetical protein [Chitiniphilus eburneus]